MVLNVAVREQPHEYVSPPGKVISCKNIWSAPYKESEDSAAIMAFREATCANVVKSSLRSVRRTLIRA